MLRQTFDPGQPYRYVRYARMSTAAQNARSPEQQFDTIDIVKKQTGHDNWIHVKDYRDDGISGRYVRKRDGFQQMLAEIKSGFITTDLILVDTLKRFGRMEELPEFRRDLHNKYGVLILSAHTSFGDPTSMEGYVFGAVDSLQSAAETREKAHNVFRGKRDAAKLGRWPGGPRPFGYELKRIPSETAGTRGYYTILVPHAEERFVIEEAFSIAYTNGWGQSLVAKALKASSTIPDKFKPFEPATVGEWFKNEIYVGTLVWPKVCTDVVDDCRVIKGVPKEEQMRIEGFCDAIVPKDHFYAVFNLRKQRAAAIAAAREAKNGDKLLEARLPGLTLKYLLTGLVRCGHCGRSMVPNGSGPYVTKSGDEKRYVGYVCPGHLAGNCSNGKRVPEEWLRKVVVDKIRERLFQAT